QGGWAVACQGIPVMGQLTGCIIGNKHGDGIVTGIRHIGESGYGNSWGYATATARASATPTASSQYEDKQRKQAEILGIYWSGNSDRVKHLVIRKRLSIKMAGKDCEISG
ncbi:MAG: hypothetical protein KZQ77_05835, partial [Candidatus Thiodiazotropha sp. (ex Notomyrtea botanica)]|nr:hypothetical protein [Candidatus Thiodiazotropha sp. (ex Notomyrtea botanica)]